MNENICLICNNQVVETQTSQMVCSVCGGLFNDNKKCKDGHYICDSCDALSVIDYIETFCINSPFVDPLGMAIILMRHPDLNLKIMEHTFLISAVLFSTYFNRLKDQSMKKKKIKEAKGVILKLPDNFENLYGISSPVFGISIFVSFISERSRVSTNKWSLTNHGVANILLSVAKYDAPKCLKRDTLIALTEGISYLRDFFDMIITHTGIECEHSPKVDACIGKKCSFFSIHFGKYEIP